MPNLGLAKSQQVNRYLDHESQRRAPAKKSDSRRSREILGVSLDPSTAKAFKAEAVARGLSVRKLFEEMWAEYLKKSSGARS